MKAQLEQQSEARPDAPAATPGVRGWKVVVFILILAPAIIVPLLLAGPAEEHQIDLTTLQQRHAEYFQIGSFRLGEPQWETLDEWPELSGRYEFPDSLADSPDTPPSAFASALYSNGEMRWVTTERSLPFAYVVPVLNSRALRPERMDILDVKLLAARVFDPADEGDRALLAQLDEALFEGFNEAEEMPMREKRRREAMPGETAARSLINAFLAEASRRDDDRAAAREVLSQPGRFAPIPGVAPLQPE